MGRRGLSGVVVVAALLALAADAVAASAKAYNYNGAAPPVTHRHKKPLADVQRKREKLLATKDLLTALDQMPRASGWRSSSPPRFAARPGWARLSCTCYGPTTSPGT
jgi:hypothetical protein